MSLVGKWHEGIGRIQEEVGEVIGTYAKDEELIDHVDRGILERAFQGTL